MEDQKKKSIQNAQPSQQEGNDEWLARGAGVDDQPFERTWRGGRLDNESSTAKLSAGSGAGEAVIERRTLDRRDIAHDPFVRLIRDERRNAGGDRRSSRRGPGVRQDRPSRFL